MFSWMPCFYFQTGPCASSVIFVHGYVRYCDRANKLQWLSYSFGLFLVIYIVSFHLLQYTKETLFTLFRSCFLSWSAERATYFREKVCYCFPFRCLWERSTVLGSLAGKLTWTKHLGCQFHVSPAVEITRINNAIVFYRQDSLEMYQLQ